MKVIQEFKNAVKVEFEGTQFIFRNEDGAISWMADGWDKYPEWRERGLIEDKFHPGEMNHTDQIWKGPRPESNTQES